jgi:hypothetical protein
VKKRDRDLSGDEQGCYRNVTFVAFAVHTIEQPPQYAPALHGHS